MAPFMWYRASLILIRVRYVRSVNPWILFTSMFIVSYGASISAIRRHWWCAVLMLATGWRPIVSSKSVPLTSMFSYLDCQRNKLHFTTSGNLSHGIFGEWLFKTIGPSIPSCVYLPLSVYFHNGEDRLAVRDFMIALSFQFIRSPADRSIPSPLF